MISDHPDEPVDASLIDRTEDALIHFASSYAIPPPEALKGKILQKLRHVARQAQHRVELDINNLPLLDEKANWLDWKAVVTGIKPPEDFEEIHLHTLEANDERELFVAWVKEFIPEEVHYDLIESFLLLEGSCECHIINEKGETRIVRMAEGDYIAMNLGEKHDIHITSSCPAKAILQWKKLAA